MLRKRLPSLKPGSIRLVDSNWSRRSSSAVICSADITDGGRRRSCYLTPVAKGSYRSAACMDWHGGTSGGLVYSTSLIRPSPRSEEHTSELQKIMRNSYAVSCEKKKKHISTQNTNKTKT